MFQNNSGQPPSSPQYIVSVNNNTFLNSGNTTLPIPGMSQSLPGSDNLSCNLDVQTGSADSQLKEDFVSNAKSGMFLDDYY